MSKQKQVDDPFKEIRQRAVELYRQSQAVSENLDKPDGALPAPEDDAEPKPWEMTPDELRAKVTAALWPTDDSAHKWVPRPPLTLDQYIRDGI